MKGQESFGFENSHTDPGLIINERPEGGQTEGCCSYTRCRNKTQEDMLMQEEIDVNFKGPKATERSETDNAQATTRSALRVNSMADDGQTALHAVVSKEHLEVVKNLLGGGSSMSKSDNGGWKRKALAEQQGNKSICDLLLSYENRKSDEHRIQFLGPEAGESTSHLKKAETNSHVRNSSFSDDRNGTEAIRKRVTIHMQFQNSNTNWQHGKLIILPDSIDELFKVAGKPFFFTQEHYLKINRKHKKLFIDFLKIRNQEHFSGRSIFIRKIRTLNSISNLSWFLHSSLLTLCETAGEKFGSSKPNKIINAENAEIDDISVIRDGDHLFLLKHDCDNIDVDMT